MKRYFLILSYLLGGLACQHSEPKTKQVALVKHQSMEIEVTDANASNYPWYNRLKSNNSLSKRIALPQDFYRIPVDEGSFEDWLRNLPLRKPNSKVYYYNDEEKFTQEIHEAVVDIDIGDRDLQKSEDAVIRLWTEYLYSQKDYERIIIPTAEDTLAFRDYYDGKPNYAQFRKFLNFAFEKTTTYSFKKSLEIIKIKSLKIGDIFIQSSPPGHAVIVVDMAKNEAEQRIFLLAQAFTPAQDIHIIKNFDNASILGSWYPTNFGTTLYTPEWEFSNNDLRRINIIDN